MAEIVVGMGRQKSLRAVATIAESTLHKIQGAPRKVTMRTRPMEVIAERTEYDGEFQSFQIRLRKVTGPVVDTLAGVASEFQDVCSKAEEDGWLVIRCAPAGDDTVPRVHECVDKLAASVLLPEVWRVQGDGYRLDHVSVELLFQAMIQYKASDVHLSPGEAPVFRIDNQTRRSDIISPLSAPQILALINEIAPDRDWQEFQEAKQASFNFHQVGLGYSRVSCFIKSGAPHITFRFLPEVIPSFDDLNIPAETMRELANLHHGLVLVVGMTGSGKSTTVAALVDWINTNKTLHILTIEDPIEYVHVNKKSIVSQRNTGIDVRTFHEAVRGALRHDPDVIVIGEMRDPDTIRSAISAAATGHLVISTLHSNTASEVINRVVSFFDPVERDLVKLQLRDAMRCVICQRLVPRVGGGRLPAIEVLFNDTKPINDAILDGNTDAMRIGMQQTVGSSFLFEEYLCDLYKQGKIDLEHAREYSTEVSILDQMLMGTYSVPRLDSIKALR